MWRSITLPPSKCKPFHLTSNTTAIEILEIKLLSFFGNLRAAGPSKIAFWQLIFPKVDDCKNEGNFCNKMPKRIYFSWETFLKSLLSASPSRQCPQHQRSQRRLRLHHRAIPTRRQQRHLQEEDSPPRRQRQDRRMDCRGEREALDPMWLRTTARQLGLSMSLLIKSSMSLR